MESRLTTSRLDFHVRFAKRRAMRVNFRPAILTAAVGALALGGITLAQGDSGNFEVSGIQVDVTAKNAETARYAGWRLAQRKGWTMLSQRLGGGASQLPDGALDA